MNKYLQYKFYTYIIENKTYLTINNKMNKSIFTQDFFLSKDELSKDDTFYLMDRN